MKIVAFAERPLRRAPSQPSPDGDIYAAPPDERARTVRAALDAGISVFHAAHEREAASLGASLKTLGVRDRVTISTTDGDALDRCPNTEDGAAHAVRAALARKRELLGVAVIDRFHLYNFRRETHTPARLAGAVRALNAAVTAGEIGAYGATCFADFDALADAVETKVFRPQTVIARYNYADPRAAARLFPVCRARHIPAWAAQPFAWFGGVPFVRFPNTWRFRNLTKNFYGITAGQAHLHWVLQNETVDGVVVSMQTEAQVRENVEAAQLTKTPTGLESLFQSFVEAITQTDAGWRGLLDDEEWEYRVAAEKTLAEGSGLSSGE